MSELTEADLTIIHMALDAYLSGPPLTTNGLARVLRLSKKLGIHREPLCCRYPDECSLLVLWEKYEKSGATPHD
jgi:hypothetical protein